MASVDDLDREADAILERFAKERALRPLIPVKAWEPMRPHIVVSVTAGELRLSWQQVKEALRSGNRELLRAAEKVFCRDLLEFLEP